MATVTLATMRETVRFRGTYENSVKFTPAHIDAEINASWAELYEVIADANEGYFDTTGTLATVANQQHVDLPADFWRLRGVDLLTGGRYYELRQVGIAERNSFQEASSLPVAYRTASGGARGRLLFYPTPSSAETIRVVYTPTYTPLSADGDTVEGYNDWTDYIICGALLRLDQREEKPLGERQQELARIRDRIVRGISQRRAAEPQYLRLNGYELDDLDYL